MASNKLREAQALERLNALKNTTKSKQGDKKKIVLIECIDIRVKTPKNIIKRPYYNILDVYYYEYIDTYAEIELIKTLMNRWQHITPLDIIPLVRDEEESNLLLTHQYHNERNKKYFDCIVKNGIFKKHLDVLRYLKNDVDINNIDNYINAKKIIINNDIIG